MSLQNDDNTVTYTSDDGRVVLILYTGPVKEEE